MEKIERINRELCHKGSILEFYADTIKTPDGNLSKWDFIKHSGAAAIVPVDENGKILMVKQYRNSVDRVTIEIPAGGINEGETPLEAASRELEEETGYVSTDLSKLIDVITAVAFCNEVIYIYLAENLTATSQNLDDDEYIDVERYDIEELETMIYSGQIMDSKTVAAIMAYKNLLNK